MIKQFTNTNGKEFLAVGVPLDASSIGYMNESYWSYFSKSKGWGQFPVKGNYKLIGTSSELTEEQIIELGLVKFVGHPWRAYEDFTNKHNWFSCPKKSFQSRLKSFGFVLDNPHKKPEEKWFYKRKDDNESWGDFYARQFKEAESKIVKVLILEKL